MGKGGGPSKQEVTQTNLPEYAKPYFQDLLGAAGAETFTRDPVTGQMTGLQPYTPYGGQRIQDFTENQMQTQQNIMGMQAPGQFGAGTDLTQAGGLQALQAAQYSPGQFNVALAQAPNLRQFQMRGPQNVMGMQQVSPEMQAAQTGYSPDLQMFQARGPEQISEGIGTFTAPGTAQQFMSPYMQAVTDVQKQAAVREAQMAQQQANLGSARQGTYGGARQAIAQAERERGLLDRLSNIQATGSQAAFDSAQKAFEQEQARRLQTGLQTQQLGTQTGLENLRAQLGVQQLGTQTDVQTALANLDKSQQAAVQNQAAQLQTQGLNADQALRAALANQQAGLTVGQQNLQARLGVQQLGAQQSLEAQRANQQALLEAQRMAEQSRQFGGTLGLQGAQAATQAGQILGQLGTAQQQSDLARLQAQQQVGAQQQALEQQRLDQAYADFLRQRDYPMEQLGYYSNLLRGLPMQLSSTQTTYATPPSMLQQIGGSAAGIYGLGKATGMFKEGGEVKDQGLAGVRLAQLMK